MSWQDDHEPGRGRALPDELRSALGQEPDFDYAALVAGTKARARRIRRRRALAQGAVAAVLIPTLVGTGFVLNNRLSVEEGPGGPALATGTPTADPAVDDVAVVTVEETVEPTGPATGQAEGTAPAPPAQTSGPSAPVLDQPPYQDPALLPELTSLETNPDLPNREDIPDPRPTGVVGLDALGAPSGWLYPRVVPLPGFVAARDNIGLDPDTGIQGHSGRSFDWAASDAPTEGVAAVTLDVGLWDDASFAMEQLRTGGTELSTFWIGGTDADGGLVVGVPDPLPWPGHDGSPDHLLVAAEEEPRHLAGALIRQGDYLVGVTVTGGDADAATALAAEVADKTAANLAFLDPVHGGE